MLTPVPVENRDRHVGTFAHHVDDPQAGFLVDGPALSGVGPSGFACQRGEASPPVRIPPCLDRAIGVILPVVSGPGARGCGPQAFGQRKSIGAQGFDVTDDLEAHKRKAFFGFWCRFLHRREVFFRHPPTFNKTLLWGGSRRAQSGAMGMISRSQCARKLR